MDRCGNVAGTDKPTFCLPQSSETSDWVDFRTGLLVPSRPSSYRCPVLLVRMPRNAPRLTSLLAWTEGLDLKCKGLVST